MKKIFTHLFAVLLLSLVSSSAWGQQTSLTHGKVYHFQNVGNTGVALGTSALTDVAAVSVDKDRTAQQWLCQVVDGYYTFRSLSNGKYLKGNSSSADWGLTDDNTDAANKFNLVTVGSNNTIYSTSHQQGSTGGGGSMHRDNGNNIVGWGANNNNSQWTITVVDYTPEALQAVWDEVEALVVSSSTVAGYQEKLDAIFTDKACTTLKSAYTNMTDDALETDANYLALPQTLRDMVKKVRGGNWSEKTVAPADRPNGNNNTNHDLWTVADTWDNDYAKKFRVQMYEPYSVEGEITSYLRINAHCNMDNPTGIYANAGEPIYIMVEGTIAEGAELWVAHQVGHGATNYYNNAAYTQLHEGLNVVPYFADGSQLWINYLVHTYNAAGTNIAEKFPEDRQLSKYKPLKIHIEGGKINGFFNAMGDYRSTEVSGNPNGGENLWGDVDNNADWNYYKARAALSGDFALLGHRQTLLFDFGTYNSTKGHFGVANADGGIEYALAYHLEHISVPEKPNCYGGSGNTFGTFAGSYSGMNLDAVNGKINIMLEAWDRIQYSEHASLGLLSVANIEKMNALYPRWTTAGEAAEIYNYGEATINNVTQTYKQFCQGIDYSEYFNHHGAAVGAGSGYMSGGWRVCNYHYNTMGSIIGKIAVEAGPTWGPAHEIGHQHQSIFNLNGQTEVTNNFHSNVAVWYMGMGTSRYNGSEGNLEHVLEAFNTDGNDLYTNNIWAITHLYYRLWLYYHLAGNNTQFWPRLFELCRQTPLVNGGQISGETSLLRFYQHACNAAGEDLTEFFRAHGFFELMTNRLVGDYSNGTYNVTEEQIETAISTIEDKGYPKNYAILLINDGTSDTTFKHDGKTKRSLWDSNASAEYGSVTDFIEGNTSVTEVYDAVVSADGTVTMSGGEGGVGFLIFNEEGELVSFSNKSTFEISDEAAYLLATGKASIVAVDAENKTREAEVDLSAIQREMLGALIAKIKAMPIDDGSYTHVGFYTEASATELLAALESAKTAYESGSGYGAAYEMLYTEKEKFVNSQNLSFVPFDPSLTYVITNYEYADHTMYLKSSDNYVYSQANIDQEAATARWQFKTTGTEDVYKVYNTNGTGSYLPKVLKSTHLSVVSDEASAVSYVLRESTPVGTWTIMLESPDDEYPALHDNSHNKVVGWGTASNPSKWYLTAVENSNSASLVATDELQALIAKTEALVDVVGMAIPCALQTTDDTAPFYLYCNANVTANNTDQSLPANGYNILDGNDQTFLHTVYSGNSADGLHHYLLLDLGEGNTLSTIQFYYKTRHNGDSKSHPQVIKVEGSNDKKTFVPIETISSGLPNEYSAEYRSSELTNGNEYRYFRFMVTDTYGTKTDGNGHEYFYIAEFGIPSLPNVYTKIDAEYKAYVTETDMQAIYNAIVTAKAALESGTDLSTAKEDLQTAYDTFYALYKKPVDEKKEELETLATATDAVIAQVGTVELGVKTPITLTASNLYCNSVDGDGGATADNKYNLADGDESTYLHTKTNNHTGEDGYGYHYLRVDLGDGVTTENFMFTYQNRTPSSYTVFPSVLTIQGSNDNSEYVDIVEISSDLPNTAGGTYESEVLGNGNAYRYFRFVVKSTHADRSTPNYFCMAEFSFTAVYERKITINQEYENIVSEDLLYSTYNTSGDSHLMAAGTSNPTLAQLEAQITKLTAAKAALEAAKNQVNKSELETSLAAINALYSKMADGKGNIASDYTPSALTPEQLTAIKTVIDNAQAVFDNTGATQLDVNNAKTAVDEKYTELLTIEIANVNLSGTLDKSGLEALIETVEDLLDIINGKADDYYATATGIAIDELQEAYDAAVDAVSRYYLTETQYTEALNELNNCYTTTNGVVAADVAGRDELTTLIANVNTLMEEIADAAADDYMPAVPLQATDEEDNFYIKLSRVGDGTIGNLIDKNSDGTGNTGTYVGSAWGGTIADYTHYVQVDLGEGVTIDKLLFDYTTRDSDHGSERPTSIKVLGSNDNSNYAEITIIDEGLADEAGEQWSMQNVLELGARYRYIRFAVKSGVNSFHMSDFNLYAEMSHTLKEYYTTAQELDFEALCMALQSAQYAAEHYLTSEQLTVVKNMLNGYYTAANSVVDADATTDARDELQALIDETETLLTEVAVINEESTVTLQTTEASNPYYIWSNAPRTANPVSNLLLDNDSYFHSEWETSNNPPAENHYLAIDFGENNYIGAFTFNYTTVADTWSKSPTAITVQGAKTIDEFTTIAELTANADGLPNSASSEDYVSKILNENGENYRYLRFVVTANRGGGTITVNEERYAYFQLSKFGITSQSAQIGIKDDYLSPNMPVSIVADAYNKQQEAEGVEDTHYFSSTELAELQAELQAAYNALNAAKNLKDFPVILTTDVNNPVLYKIKINRDGDKRLDFDSSSTMVAVDDETVGDKYQAWYFMQGTDDSVYDDIRIFPYWNNGAANTTLMLGSNDISEGNSKVKAVDGTDANYTTNWYITFTEGSTAAGWWNIQPQGKANYFSNHGGVSHKMGFYNHSDDAGSQFQFILDDTDYSLSDAYFALYNKHAEFGGTLTGGEAIGDYVVASVAAYNEAYNNAGVLLEAKASTDDVYTTARETLAGSFAAIEYVMPEEGKLYMIKSISTQTYCSGKYVHALCDARQGYNNQNHKHLVFDALGDITQLPLAVFTFEDVNATNGECKMKNLHTGMYVKSFEKGEEHMTTDYASAASVKIGNFAPGQAILRIGNKNPMHAQDANRVIVSWGAAAENASLWSIDEVTDISQVVHNVTMSAKFSSVMLGYNATVPAGVEAYIATGISGGYVSLEEVAGPGETLPAATPVILYRTDDETSKVFTYSEETPVIVDGESLLGGSLFMKYVECDTQKDYYKLMLKDGEAKMYWMYKEFDENGTYGENNVNQGTDNGRHIKCSANKIYMALPKSGSNPVTMYGMRFIDDSATGIEEMKGVSGEVKAIYDLQGRKLTEITEPGMYIVDGKKVYVK